MKKSTIFLIFIIIVPVLILSCSKEGDIAGSYRQHVSRVYSIILKHPKNAETAAAEVYDYVEKNQEKIEKASKQMKQLTAKQTENVYLSVIQEVNKLVEYIKNHTTDEYPLGVQEKLGIALQILLQ